MLDGVMLSSSVATQLLGFRHIKHVLPNWTFVLNSLNSCQTGERRKQALKILGAVLNLSNLIIAERERPTFKTGKELSTSNRIAKVKVSVFITLI